MDAVAYLVNEHPAYLRMTLNSISMLRQHNRILPVHAFLVGDGSSQTIERDTITRRVAHDAGNTNRFMIACESLGVRVIHKDPLAIPGEERFFHANRAYLAELPEENILYIDSDTFIFGDISIIFENHRHVDFAACRASWALNRGWDHNFLAVPVGPFSSGVMLWNGGSIRDWCSMIPSYFAGFRRNDTPLANWLHSLHPDCLLREEFSVSLHISISELSHSFLDDEVHLIRSDQCIANLGDKTIFHCYTPNWRKCYSRLSGNNRKIAFWKIKSKGLNI